MLSVLTWSITIRMGIQFFYTSHLDVIGLSVSISKYILILVHEDPEEYAQSKTTIGNTEVFFSLRRYSLWGVFLCQKENYVI